MGESNEAGRALIAELMGSQPLYGETAEGHQCLHIGNHTIVAKSFALWGDPSVWQHDEDALSVAWGGVSVRFRRDEAGSWIAQEHIERIGGTARWVP